MEKKITKRSKAIIYKNQLDKAVIILKRVATLSEDFEYKGYDAIFEIAEKINDINFEIEHLLEEVENE